MIMKFPFHSVPFVTRSSIRSFVRSFIDGSGIKAVSVIQKHISTRNSIQTRYNTLYPLKKLCERVYLIMLVNIQ